MSKWTRIASCMVSLGLMTIAPNPISLKIYYDIAVRDIVMAVGAMALSMLTKAAEDRE